MNQQENPSTEAEKLLNTNTAKSTNEMVKDVLQLLFFAGMIIALDQWTKNLVVKNLAFLDTWLPENLLGLEPYARIVHWHNSGAAFGMFQDGNLVIMVLAVIASLFIIYYFPQIEKSEWPIRAAMVFQLAGATGNLIDRFQYNYVIDFISIMDFPVFNVADASITVGVSVLVIGIILEELKVRKENKDQINNDEGNTPLEESNV